MEKKEEIKKRLRTEGYSVIHAYDDPAGEVFPDHDHETDQIIVIVRGLIEIRMQGKISLLSPGDEIFFPKKVIHSATVGPEGCFYIHGEKA